MTVYDEIRWQINLTTAAGIEFGKLLERERHETPKELGTLAAKAVLKAFHGDATDNDRR
jgi:hypothetical protein